LALIPFPAQVFHFSLLGPSVVFEKG
jgi:hypothetical protein